MCVSSEILKFIRVVLVGIASSGVHVHLMYSHNYVASNSCTSSEMANTKTREYIMSVCVFSALPDVQLVLSTLYFTIIMYP